MRLTPKVTQMLPRPNSERTRVHYKNGHWRKETIYDLAAAHARKTPNAWAIQDRNRRLTYRELVDAADALAGDMKIRGLELEDRVAIWLPSRVEIAIAFLACSRSGYVCAPGFQRNHSVDEVVELLKRISARTLIMQNDYAVDSDYQTIRSRLKTLNSLKKISKFTNLYNYFVHFILNISMLTYLK